MLKRIAKDAVATSGFHYAAAGNAHTRAPAAAASSSRTSTRAGAAAVKLESGTRVRSRSPKGSPPAKSTSGSRVKLELHTPRVQSGNSYDDLEIDIDGAAPSTKAKGGHAYQRKQLNVKEALDDYSDGSMGRSPGPANVLFGCGLHSKLCGFLKLLSRPVDTLT